MNKKSYSQQTKQEVHPTTIDSLKERQDANKQTALLDKSADKKQEKVSKLCFPAGAEKSPVNIHSSQQPTLGKMKGDDQLCQDMKQAFSPAGCDIHQILNEIEKKLDLFKPPFKESDGLSIVSLTMEHYGIIRGYLCAINQEIEFLEMLFNRIDLETRNKLDEVHMKRIINQRLQELTKIKEEMERK